MGIIGMSEGNGHPYSWSAIFNGYDRAAMSACPFPVIPRYLSERSFPADFLGDLGKVTHVWTQSDRLSRHVAAASQIEQVVDRPEDMIGCIDALLLARDDAEHHLDFARPFLEAGLPVYIDKPLALTPATAERILRLEQWEGQVFTCSAMRFASELIPSSESIARLGNLSSIEGRSPESWARYAVHVVEPVVALLAREELLSYAASRSAADHGTGGRHVTAQLANGLHLSFATSGRDPSAITVLLQGSRGEQRLTFSDSFAAFRSALAKFVVAARDRSAVIPRKETRKVVEILSWGI